MWRPGRLRFLIGMKNSLRQATTARKHDPLQSRVGRQIRDFSRLSELDPENETGG